MANSTNPEDQITKAIDDAIERALAGLGDVKLLTRVGTTLENVVATFVKLAVTVLLRVSHPVLLGLAKGQIGAEELSNPAYGELARLAVRDLFDVDVPPPNTSKGGGSNFDANAGQAVGRALMQGVTKAAPGGTGTLAPGSAAAEAYLGSMAQFALEGWLQGWMSEIRFLGQIESMAQLDDAMSNTFGFGRVSSRVLRAVVEPLAITPLKWQINKNYRPELFSAAECARQIARNPEQREKWLEELRRQGYREDQIEALVAAQQKTFSPGDVRTFVNRSHWTRERGIAHLKNQGFTEDEALDSLRLEGLRRIEQLEDQEAAAIVAAFARGDIDRGTLIAMIGAAVTSESERALLMELADVRASLNIRRLSASQVETMVKSGVLSVIDYRRAIEREGYPPEDVGALELQLRWELDKATEIAQHRAAMEAERAEEKRRREEERAARLAAIEREREQDRRGPLAAIEAAAVRGLVPLSRAEELYAFRYDAATVAELMDLLEEKRQDYIAQQAARAEAIKRGERRNVSIGDLEQGVLSGVLTIEQFRNAIGEMGFDAGDVALLTATLDARKVALDDAKAKRAAAEAAAGRRSIDLGRFERLVRLGLRTVQQYAALLDELGFDDGSIAAMRELLDADIAADTRAREERAAAEERLRSKGLSLEQFRRGVLLNVATPADYERFLLEQGFRSDAVAMLMAELRADLADADAARARREKATSQSGVRELSLSTARRAAQLGVISPDAYAERLAGAGYQDDAIAIELELLLIEIADIQARRGAREQTSGADGGRGLTLAQVERAVKAGTQSLDDYRAAAAAAGYTSAATAELIELLTIELQQLADGRRRREQIAGELAARNLSLGQLEEAVTKDLRTLDDFYAELRGYGYGSDDAELLTTMLALDLEAKAAK